MKATGRGPDMKKFLSDGLLPSPISIETPVAVLIANEYLNRINFEQLINSRVVWDSERWKVSPGVLAKSIILSTFYEIRSPLYRVADRFEHADVEFLFGKGVATADLNDSALAASLDRINAAGTDKTFSSLSLSAYTMFDLSMDRLHGDTSNMVMYGAYEMCDAPNYTGLNITNGHSKANRPDKKQVGVGRIVNQDGIALVSQTLNGNKADCVWNAEAITLLKEVLGEERLSRSIYIADCKLVTMPNIHLLCDKGAPVQFVSLCPSSFFGKINEKMVEQAYLDDNWSEQVSLNAEKDYAKYRMQDYTQKVEGHELRFTVVETTSKQNSVDKLIKRERQSFEKALSNLVKQTFDSEKDAQKALKSFQFSQKKKLFTVSLAVDSETTIKYKRGRRSKDQPATVDSEATTWHIRAGEISPHKENTDKAIRNEMTFVLITNITGEKLTSQEVLFTYKGQAVVEVGFHLIKQPCLASTIFLDTPGRIDALVMLLNVALLIRGLMQYQARKNLKLLGEAPKIGIGGRKFVRPTAENMIILLRNFIIQSDGKNHYVTAIHNPKSAERFRVLLTLLDVNKNAFFVS
jgi:transposase